MNEWFNTSNYVYNKTIEKIKNGSAINRISLRDELVTKNSKKGHPEYITMTNKIKDVHKKLKETTDKKEILKIKQEIKDKNKELRTIAKTLVKLENKNVSDREIITPKEIRADTVIDVCKNYKSAIENFKNGNIKKFDMSFRKKNRESNCISIQKKLISIVDSKIKIAPDFLKEDTLFDIGKKTLKKLELREIVHTCRLKKEKGKYTLYIPTKVTRVPKSEIKDTLVYTGVDPGSRTFLTSFGNEEYTEYTFFNKVKKVDNKIRSMKYNRIKRKHKKNFNKLESMKKHLVDELHWKTINHLLDNNDVVFFGDIKTHNIVKSKNHTLNRDINNLKFFLFKQRLLYSSKVKRKTVVFVPEHYTTLTCSSCGEKNDPGMSKIYNCKHCKRTFGRDLNAAKNMLLKGMNNIIEYIGKTVHL